MTILYWLTFVYLQEKMSRLEQEKEHWMLESQLLQMKYEKEQQVSDLDLLTWLTC